jgi:hypothetical protein
MHYWRVVARWIFLPATKSPGGRIATVKFLLEEKGARAANVLIARGFFTVGVI